MPAKTKNIQGAGVGITLDGKMLSRVQSFTVDTDLGVEEIRELTNASVVEFVEGLPTVSVSIEANQIGSRANLAALTGMDGGEQVRVTAGTAGHDEITHFSFDGTSVDLCAHIEEDTVLARSMYVGSAFVTGLGFNYDVSGVATENYSLEADNKVWYFNDYKEIVVVSGYILAGDGDIDSAGDATTISGIKIRPHADLVGSYFQAPDFNTNDGEFTALFVTADGEIVKDAANAVKAPLAPVDASGDYLTFDPVSLYYSQLVGKTRFRAVGYKNTPNTAITIGTTDTATLGGLRKGMVEIFLVSGSMWQIENRTAAYKEEFLRLQTVSIDVDLSRTALEELGNPEAYKRSLNFPISATVNFSTLATDIQAWAGFADQSMGYQTVTGYNESEFRDFVQNHGVLIKIYDDDETNAGRAHLMTLTVSGIRVASESYSVNAGDNATQEFSCTADNFVIS